MILILVCIQSHHQSSYTTIYTVQLSVGLLHPVGPDKDDKNIYLSVIITFLSLFLILLGKGFSLLVNYSVGTN